MPPPITYRLVKGSPLTGLEYDNTLHNFDDRIVVLEALPVGVTFTDITVSGGKYYFHQSDGTTIGPVDVPPSWTFRGAWEAAQVYFVGDVVTAIGKTFEVLFNHTSAGSFDPAASDGLGHDYYGLLLENPAAVLPTGGTTGQVLAKVSNTDFDDHWITLPPSVPAGGTTGQALTKISNTDYDIHWSTVSSSIATLSDVVLTSLASGDLLQWNGSQWVNVTRLGLGLVFADLTDSPSTIQLRDQTYPYALATSGAVSINPDNGSIQTVSPSGNITFSASGTPTGGELTIIVTTANTTSRTITFAGALFATGTLVTGTVAFKTFVINFICDGGTWWERSRTTAM